MAVEIAGGGGTVTVIQPSSVVTAMSAQSAVGVSTAVIAGGIPYSGSYEITPSSEAQTIQATSRVFARDILVKPIPSNYGLISWDGSTITVS